MFALPLPTAAHVRTFNLRTEKHGDDDVTAMDLGIRLTGSSEMLDMIHPGLRGQLYLPPDPSQASIPGETAPWTELRCAAVPSVDVKYELVGRDVVLEPSSEIESELRDDDRLALGSCNVNKFKVTAYRGGSVDIDFRIQTSDIDGAAIGMAGAMLAQDVKLSLTHTEVPAETEATGSETKQASDETKDATDLFVAGAAEPERGEGWPFPGQAPDDAPPAHMTEPKTSKKQRTALGTP